MRERRTERLEDEEAGKRQKRCRATKAKINKEIESKERKEDGKRHLEVRIEGKTCKRQERDKKKIDRKRGEG